MVMPQVQEVSNFQFECALYIYLVYKAVFLEALTQCFNNYNNSSFYNFLFVETRTLMCFYLSWNPQWSPQ